MQTSYIWTLPGGATGTSTTNSITLNYGTSAVSGDITVKGNNSCGDGTSSSLPIIVNAIPTTPIISINGLILQSDASTGNQWYNQNGIINGDTNQYCYPAIEGDYFVIVIQNGCSSDTSNVINVVFTGLGSIENNNIKVYPNPVSK